jgi:hypothetical protein
MYYITLMKVMLVKKIRYFVSSKMRVQNDGTSLSSKHTHIRKYYPVRPRTALRQQHLKRHTNL